MVSSQIHQVLFPEWWFIFPSESCASIEYSSRWTDRFGNPLPWLRFLTEVAVWQLWCLYQSDIQLFTPASHADGPGLQRWQSKLCLNFSSLKVSSLIMNPHPPTPLPTASRTDCLKTGLHCPLTLLLHKIIFFLINNCLMPAKGK